MFDRFVIVQAHYLYASRGFSFLSARRCRKAAVLLSKFRPSLTLSQATGSRTYSPYVYGTALPKVDDYQSTRDAYAALLRREREALRQAR